MNHAARCNKTASCSRNAMSVLSRTQVHHSRPLNSQLSDVGHYQLFAYGVYVYAAQYNPVRWQLKEVSDERPCVTLYTSAHRRGQAHTAVSGTRRTVAWSKIRPKAARHGRHLMPAPTRQGYGNSAPHSADNI